ncbi:MAG: dihydropteroate synthase [bacterium]|nr:dihydropteroate synthase [bacterium]
MEYNIRVLEIFNEKEAVSQMERLGVDAKGIELMSPKALSRVLKLERLELKIALILKQEMLSLGGEAALRREAITLNCQTTDVLLIGSLKHYQRLISKLKDQYFGLAKLAVEIEAVLNNFIRDEFNLVCGKYQLNLGRRTFIMGILNITPDSFSDGGQYQEVDKAIERGIRMAEEGADIIDIGGESTRPGAVPCSIEEELNRVIPVIKGLTDKIDIPISIDTYKAEVARRALEEGAQMVNDISALSFNPKMAQMVAEYKAPVVLMHIQGTPQDMQQNPQYTCVISEIILYLCERIKVAIESGIEADKIIIDPGIGFGKTVEHNLEILRRLREFKSLGRPILIGTSRKSFVGKILDLPVEQRLEGTLATAVISILNGANIIRVHDVLAMKRVAKMVDAIIR